MNQDMDPCTDFYEFACGGYERKTMLPTGYPKWNYAMQISDSIYLTIKDLLENPHTKYEGMAERQAKIYYDSCLDKTNVRKKLQGMPLKKLLDLYGGWDLLNVYKKSSAFINASSTLKKIRYPEKGFPDKFNSVFFSLDIHLDPKNSSKNLLFIFPGELTFPHKDYYDDNDLYNSSLMYMAKIGNLLLKNRTVSKYLEMLDENIKFNQHAINKSDLNRTQKEKKKQMWSQLRNVMSNILDLEKLIANMNWTSFINQIFKPLNISIAADHPFWVTSISYMEALTSLIKQYLNEPNSSRILHDYIMWHKIRPLTRYLSKKFSYDPNVKDNTSSDWKLCLEEFPMFMNFPLSSLYLKSNFYSRDKLKLKEMVDMIKLSYKKSLQDLNWMDKTTKARSIAKVDAMKFKIGYPDYIINPNELDKDYLGALKSYQAMNKSAIYSSKSNITDEQLFFLAYAQIYCSKETLENQLLEITIDLHSPKKYRINGVVSNLKQFSKAFNCSAKANMNPLNKCTLWI
ncbi:unnamed protein product [Gordionus sp. m RMFG-2023]